MKRRRPVRRGREEEPFKVNERIRAREVRVVGDDIEGDNVLSIENAISLAKSKGLDLVLISEKATPPVCRVVEYSKFKYDHKKKQKELKAKAHKTILKEIRFGPNTDEHDFNFKLKHAEKFLQEGAKVKAYVHFAGRTIVYKERGELLLLKFAEALEEHGKVEQLPKMEGKRMILFLAPKKVPKKG